MADLFDKFFYNSPLAPETVGRDDAVVALLQRRGERGCALTRLITIP